MRRFYIKQLFLTMAALLCSATVSAYDFEVDGIYYNILTISDLTVEVTYGDKKYSGEVVIPSTVSYKSKTLTITSIGNKAFYDCSGLTSVTIPNSVTYIGNKAFYDCSGLTSVTIPNSVTYIGNYAFYNCTSLKDLRIEDGDTTLSLGYNSNKGLFYDCPLESLYLGRNIQYKTGYDYGYSPFYGKTKLKSVTIGNSVTSIGERAFYDCSGLTSVTIPNSITSIGYGAFDNCSGLTSITIPNSVTTIGNWAFSNCINLESVTIGNSVTTIGNWAFSNCINLESVTIGNSVTTIGEYAFSACKTIASIRLLGETPPIVGSGTFTNKQYINMIVYVPKGTLATYQAADTWKDFWDIQEFDPTGIDDVADDAPAFEITTGGIQLTAAESKAIAIYTAGGALVEKIDNYAGEEIILDKGVYILRVGDKAMKVKL